MYLIKPKVMMATQWAAMMSGGGAAWTVAVPKLVTLSVMRQGPLDGRRGYDQRRKQAAQQIRSEPSDLPLILRPK
ncbi:hypothetical protein V6N13_048541 [Hibiscus sabdariffa]